MKTESTVFCIERKGSRTRADVTLQGIRAALERKFPVLAQDPVTESRQYFDTFDWRLYTAGTELSGFQDEEDGWSLEWRDLDGTLRKHWQLETLPRFAWDFPDTDFDEMYEVLEMRALLDLVSIQRRIQRVAIVDGLTKTVVRISLESGDVTSHRDGNRRPLTEVITARGVRGYPKNFAAVERFLQKLPLTPTEQRPLELCLDAIGRRPKDYSSKLSLQLDPAMRADAAAKAVYIHLLDTLERNEAGTLADFDSEFLHDFRVAVRRTRSGLSQIKGVFPDKITAKYAQEFKWLGKLTNWTRDLDVYLLRLRDYHAVLPPEVARDLDPLRGYLIGAQVTSQQKMSAEIQSPRYRKLLRDWRRYLEADVPKRTTSPYAKQPILKVASDRIWKVYRRVIKDGVAIGQDSPAEDLHRLRIDCKKLRYLLEFFRSLYPKSEITSLVRALKALQNTLGDFQDFEVQQTSLAHFAEDMAAQGVAPPPTFLAMGRLLTVLDERQHDAREQFYEEFEHFAAPEFRALAKSLFKGRS